MQAVLYTIPIVPWVRTTIAKMDRGDADDAQAWNRYWLESYYELGGKSESVGTKGCPKSAAYDLWWLGRIVDGGRPVHNLPLSDTKQQLGENAVYAILALALLEQGQSLRDREKLWTEIRWRYQQQFVDKPALSQQGAVSIACALFEAGQIVRKMP